jgi:hypothetical protein
MVSIVNGVKRQQRLRAIEHGIAVDELGYTFRLDDNLFTPLCSDSLDEFDASDGSELGTPDRRGKMQALHSSSALAYNVFEYWRGRDSSVLAQALKIASPITHLEYGRRFPTGLPGFPPNLDVVLTLASNALVAIECKFLEPYGDNRPAGFQPSYFMNSGLWSQFGYNGCQKLAKRLYSGREGFQWLNAEQLLKHILGLARLTMPWELLCLWYEVPGDAAFEHGVEADEFAELAAADGIAFRAISYQTLYEEMESIANDADKPYLEYLGSRYLKRPDEQADQ